VILAAMSEIEAEQKMNQAAVAAAGEDAVR
jgi:hypothetical protein